MSPPGPFNAACSIKDRAGTVLAAANATVTPRAQEPGAAGETYHFDAVITAAAKDALIGRQNRILVIGADEYRVVAAIWRPIIGYVEAELRQNRPNG